MKLRIYFFQSWYALSDPVAEKSFHVIEAKRRFSGIELGDGPIPDQMATLIFRHLPEKHHLTEKLFAELNAYLAYRGVTLCFGRCSAAARPRRKR